jgi:integrase
MPKLSATRITDKTVKNAKPRDITYDIRDAVLRGFSLKVQPSGSKAFYAEWARGKRSRIGDAALITVTRAREIAAQRISAAKTGETPQPQIRNSIPTLGKFINGKFSEWAFTEQRSAASNVQRINSVFDEYLNTRIDKLTGWQFEQWKSRRKHEGRAIATINRDLATLRKALNLAVDWEVIATSPLEKVKQLEMDENMRVRYLSGDEEKRLMNALVEREAEIFSGHISIANGVIALPQPGTFADHLRPMVLISMHTGIRYGELSKLRWEDVCLTDAPQLTVKSAYSKNRKTRHIPLNVTAKTTLKAWQAQQADTTGLVFTTLSGARIRSVKRGWLRVLKTAGIQDFRWHDLRHHFASRLVINKIDLNTVRELLGHKTIQMTLRYAHLAPEIKADAVAQLDSA